MVNFFLTMEFLSQSVPWHLTQITLGYHRFEVLKDFDVPSSRIAPWFDEPGGAVQYKWSQGAQWLIDNG